jgi:hypothetical protein
MDEVLRNFGVVTSSHAPECRLNVRFTSERHPLHPVGDILKALDEENLLQFGQVSVVGTTGYARLTLMTLPFARQNVGASKNAHPALGACQSEKLELESGSVALRQRLDHQILCAYYLQESRRKLRHSPDGRLAESRLSSKVTGPSTASARP